MRIPVIYLIIMFSFLFSNSSCKGQKKDKDLINRKPVVAGQFYAGNPTELREDLKVLFLKAKPKEVSDVVAIISPHAGYVYSGEVAASSFNQIDPLKCYDRIFIIGSSHRAHFNGASIYNMGNYVTPLGEVEVDIDLADKLIQENKIFSFNETAHSQEHSLEVQLPFLQYVMKSEFRIVPIVIGSQTVEAAEQIARALKPFFNQNNLFVISSDFSHYPHYKDAVRVDGETADAVVTKSPGELMAVLEEHANERVSNLATSMCGWTSMLTLLNMIKDMPDTEIIPIQYKNSGDVDFGDKNRVVGYWSMAVTKKSTSAVSGFNLTDKDKNDLLHIARATVAEYIKNNRLPEIDASDFSETLHTPTGAFVTLHKNGDLRGCIGNFRPDKPLYLVVQDMAVSASTKDHRFSKVKSSEVDKLDIEISVLTPMRKIESIDEIKLGKHGIYIRQGYHTGTFLPQVATQTGWDLEEFLGHCARDKAGIGWEGWKTAEVYIYEALVFDEAEFEE